MKIERWKAVPMYEEIITLEPADESDMNDVFVRAGDHDAEIERLREIIEEQRLTIASLNSTIGGVGSLTTDNLTTVERLRELLIAALTGLEFPNIEDVWLRVPPYVLRSTCEAVTKQAKRAADQSATVAIIPAHSLSEFWRDVYPTGMTLEQVCNELSDLEVMAGEVPKVYDHVTGGRVSKPMTYASVVNALHDEYLERLVQELAKELVEEQEQLESCHHHQGYYQSVIDQPALFPYPSGAEQCEHSFVAASTKWRYCGKCGRRFVITSNADDKQGEKDDEQ